MEIANKIGNAYFLTLVKVSGKIDEHLGCSSISFLLEEDKMNGAWHPDLMLT
ncbi:hypothetical protein ACFQ88_01700 [Paenibacillus sp. NPDC056579]|uniref:hypothetical protein n=1 Tax=Paenibacillus sp. NPDC056579 TaxID=3345871 RepID=UPI0036CB65C9